MRAQETDFNLKSAKALAIAVNSAGEIVDQSPHAQPLVKSWGDRNEKLGSLWESARGSSVPAEARVSLGSELKLWVSAVPQGESVVFVARDTTLPDKMTEALMESRALLRDLLDNAADLSFEVDKEGCFRFLSPVKAFGFATDRWLGQRADAIFWPKSDAPPKNPFKTKTAMAFPPLPIKLRKDEPRRWIKISAWPVKDGGGVRGVIHDVTEQVTKEKNIRAVNLRLKVQTRLTNIINSADSAKELMERASKALQEVLRAGSVCALMQYGRDLVPMAIEGDEATRLNFEAVWLALKEHGDEKLFPVTLDQQAYLVLKLANRNDTLGAIVIARDTWISPWSEQEIELLGSVSDSLVAAFEKATLVEKLHQLSSRDELTGVMNRRALKEALDERLLNQTRTGMAGSLLFIDLDYFKEVNDTLGHKVGDQALKMVAEHLKDIVRPSDFVGRVGGDEFIIWLEGALAKDAKIKARELLDAMPRIREAIGASHLGLSASIGVSQSVPGVDTALEHLSERADQALYDVKRSGRGGIAVATPPENTAENNDEDRG